MKQLVMIVIATVFYTGIANAAARCGRQLVSIGTPLKAVESICGAPAARATQALPLRANGVPKKGGTKTDILVYGPNGGAWQYFLFQNEELVRVEMRRKAPAGDGLKW